MIRICNIIPNYKYKVLEGIRCILKYHKEGKICFEKKEIQKKYGRISEKQFSKIVDSLNNLTVLYTLRKIPAVCKRNGFDTIEEQIVSETKYWLISEKIFEVKLKTSEKAMFHIKEEFYQVLEDNHMDFEEFLQCCEKEVENLLPKPKKQDCYGMFRIKNNNFWGTEGYKNERYATIYDGTFETLKQEKCNYFFYAFSHEIEDSVFFNALDDFRKKENRKIYLHLLCIEKHYRVSVKEKVDLFFRFDEITIIAKEDISRITKILDKKCEYQCIFFN